MRLSLWKCVVGEGEGREGGEEWRVSVVVLSCGRGGLGEVRIFGGCEEKRKRK